MGLDSTLPFKAWPRERALWLRERAPKMFRLVCQEHKGVQTSIHVKRPCWELPTSVRPHLYMCVQKMHIYIYIYIYINMLESYYLYNQKALRELGTVPPRELGTVHLLGGPLSHYKNRGVWEFWCKHLVPISVFGFSVFSQLGTLVGSCYSSDIQQPLFSESLFMR